MDPRIPRRDHEVNRLTAIHWYRIRTPWLRHGAMFWTRRRIESEEAAWSSALGDRSSFAHFDQFVQNNALASPELLDDHTKLRPLMLRYLSDLRSEPKTRAGHGTGPRSRSAVQGISSTIRGF